MEEHGALKKKDKGVRYGAVKWSEYHFNDVVHAINGIG